MILPMLARRTRKPGGRVAPHAKLNILRILVAAFRALHGNEPLPASIAFIGNQKF
jgi:hypothetical protein